MGHKAFYAEKTNRRLGRSKFLTVYQITRHYGGPEEGGWWYNWYEPVVTGPSPKFFRGTSMRKVKKVNAYYDRMDRFWRQRNEGNIYHANGGIEFWVCEENRQFENSTKVKPHYE